MEPVRSVPSHVSSQRILPAFGKMPPDGIGPEDVAAWFDAASRDKPGAANRAFEILRAMMFRRRGMGLARARRQPLSRHRQEPEEQRRPVLDTDELARLGRVLDAREAEWPEAVAAVRLLALTGCRRSEVLNLRWRDIGAEAINLPDSKTGPRAVPLGEAARENIAALPGGHESHGANIVWLPAGGRFAPTRNSVGYACMTCAIRRPVKPSCPARICHWSGNCSAEVVGSSVTMPPGFRGRNTGAERPKREAFRATAPALYRQGRGKILRKVTPYGRVMSSAQTLPARSCADEALERRIVEVTQASSKIRRYLRPSLVTSNFTSPPV